MEAQLQRTHDHHRHEEDPHHHSVMEGGGEAEHNHHGEKKSVLTKVKNKAKKIKDKIKHAGHTHEDNDDYDFDDDEETVNPSDVHGAPTVNETAFISGTALPKQTGLSLGNPTNLPSARDEPVYDDVGNFRTATAPDSEMRPNIGVDPVTKNSPLLDNNPYIPRIQKTEYSGARDVGVGLGKVRRPVEDPKTDLLDPPPSTIGSEQRANIAEPMVKIAPLGALEEDPHCPKTDPGAIPPPNYQAKVADPTGKGGAEADVAPLLRRLDNLHVVEEHEPKIESEERTYAGSHDQFAPEPMIPTSDEQFNPESFDAERPESMPRDTVAGKISAATSAITDKAASAKNAVASKLGYGGSQTQQGQVQVQEQEQERERPQKSTLESVSEYGHRVAEQLAPVYEKAAGAGSAIMSKVQRSGGEGGGAVKEESDKGVSVQNYFVEKFSPGEEDRELSKVITDAIHGRKGEAAAAKETIRVEAVASDEKAAAGVVDRVKGAVGSWLGKNRGQQGGGEGLEKEITSKLQE